MDTGRRDATASWKRLALTRLAGQMARLRRG